MLNWRNSGWDSAGVLEVPFVVAATFWDLERFVGEAKPLDLGFGILGAESTIKIGVSGSKRSKKKVSMIFDLQSDSWEDLLVSTASSFPIITSYSGK